jgi:hypothetical protein
MVESSVRVIGQVTGCDCADYCAGGQVYCYGVAGSVSGEEISSYQRSWTT